MSNKYFLKLCIEHKRNVMIDAVNNHGFNAEITVKLSQELDELLNEYSKIVIKKQKSKLPNFQF